MENLDIEKIIIDNFYKIIEKDNEPKKEIKRHIKDIQEGLNIIKQNGDLETLTMLYIIKEKLYKELSQAKQTILIKDNRGIFEGIKIAIFFALGYEKPSFRLQVQCKDETDKHIFLEVPKKFVDKVIDILNTNYKDWKNIFKVEILE